MKKRALLGAILGIFSASALAQLGGGGFPGGGMGGGRRGSRGGTGTGDRPADGKSGAPEAPRVNSLEITLEEFHEDLKLVQAQEPAWQAYADSVRALASDVARQSKARSSVSAVQATLLQRVDAVVDVARDRLTALEDVADRAKALYASFSPEQRAIADPRLANLVSQAAGPSALAGATQRPRSR